MRNLAAALVATLLLAGLAPAQEAPADSTVPDTLQGATGESAVSGSSAAEAVGEAPDRPRVSFDVVLEARDGTESQLGRMVIEVRPDAAPRHAANFVSLARKGAYEGTAFHRIVPGFMVQGGDPLSKRDWSAPAVGTGGPGYTLEPEIGLRHTRGAVAASRQAEDNPGKVSNGSQFFICLADLPSLDAAGYSVFGSVVEGMDTVDKIARVKNAGARNQNRALQQVVLRNVKVLEP